MSVAEQITRIQQCRDIIRAKLVELGLALSNDTLDALAAAVNNIIDRGSVSATVREGETYNIPKGYHDGSGTVSGVGGGGSYTLQSKTVTPTKAQQSITPDGGYYGLSDVTVRAIPENYQDISGTTAAAGDVRSGKIYVNAAGVTTAGTMPEVGSVSITLDVETTRYVIPVGWHSGMGVVSIMVGDATVTPTRQQQTIRPAAGEVLGQIVVNAIPNEYQDTSGVTATAADVLKGKVIVTEDGEVVGEMPNNGAVAMEITGLTTTMARISEGYHNGNGFVALTMDIENALAAI